MNLARAWELSAAFARVSRHEGLRAALSRSARRLYDRLARPLLRRIDVQKTELQALRAQGATELLTLRGELGGLRTELQTIRTELQAIRADKDDLRALLQRHSASLRWLVEHPAGTQTAGSPLPSGGGTPHVSVIMPVWNREATVGRAIQSVCAQTFTNWELLVIDDGSTDGTPEVVERYRADPRVRYLVQPQSGAAVARNRGLNESRGEIIAYLDSDNIWYEGALAAVVQGFGSDPECDAVYTAQLWCDAATETAWVRSFPFDWESILEMRTGIDLNAFAHRRTLYDQLGGFDTSLTRMMDWDLVLRYTARRTAKQLPVLGGRYEAGGWRRITNCENYARNHFLIRRKFDHPLARGLALPGEPGEGSPSLLASRVRDGGAANRSSLRVLYALWHYPQLSESYVATEIDCLRRWGIHVEVWSEVAPASPSPTTVPIHHGSLAQAIRKVRPDVLHTHWLTMVDPCRDEAARAGVPLTVRGHSFEFRPELIPLLENDPVVGGVYLFPHQVAACPPGLSKIRSLNCCFNPERYYPAVKDPRLVLRAGAGLPSKDLQLFMRVAQRCPEYRFVMAVVRCNRVESYVDDLITFNRSLGSPVELHVNLPPEEIDPLMRRASIYLHTHGPSGHGMPMTIAESMATGGFILARRHPAFAAYLGEAGCLYDTDDHAAEMIRDTLHWSDDPWRQVRERAVEKAYRYFPDALVLRPLVEDWLRLTPAHGGLISTVRGRQE